MLNGVEARAHLRILDRTIVLEVLHNRAREHRPLCGLDTGRCLPLVIARVDPRVPEGERDLELRDTVVVTGGEAVLETVESPSDLVELSGFMRRRVGREIAGKQLACIRDRQHCASLRWA